MNAMEPLLPGDPIASLLAAAATWVLALALGRALLPACAATTRFEALGRLATSCVVGTTLLSLLVLAASQLGWLRPLPLVMSSLTVGLGAAAFRWRALGMELRLVAWTRHAGEAVPDRRAGWAAALLIALPVLAAGLLATLPTVYYDDLVYHLGLPRQALLTGRWPAMPGFHYSFMPAGWDAVHVLPLAVGGGLGPQWRNVLGLALFALAAVCLARRGAGGLAAVAAAALLLSSPMMVSLGAFASDDLFVGLAAAVAFERALAGRSLQAGLAAGAAWGAKYTGLPVLAVTALLVMFHPASCPAGRRVGRAAAAFGLGLLLPAGWTLRTLILTGNPVFPAFWPILGGRHWDAVASALLARDVQGGTFADRGPLALALTPWDWLVRPEELAHPGGLQPLYLVMGFFGLLLMRRLPSGRALAGAALLLLVAACMTSIYPRFALPLFVALLPFVAASMQRAWTSTRGRVGRALLGLVLVFACLAGTARGVLRHLADYGGGGSVLLERRSDVLASRIELARAEAELARHLPADARVLCVGEARLALMPRIAVASSGYDPSWPALTISEGAQDAALAARFESFTHVLVNLRELDRFASDYAFREHFPGRTAEAFFAWLADLEPVARWGPIVLSANPEAASP